MRDQQVGIVIRANGEVPFEADVHPLVRQAIIETIVAGGFPLEQHPETGVLRIPGWDSGQSAKT